MPEALQFSTGLGCPEAIPRLPSSSRRVFLARGDPSIDIPLRRSPIWVCFASYVRPRGLEKPGLSTQRSGSSYPGRWWRPVRDP